MRRLSDDDRQLEGAIEIEHGNCGNRPFLRHEPAISNDRSLTRDDYGLGACLTREEPTQTDESRCNKGKSHLRRVLGSSLALPTERTKLSCQYIHSWSHAFVERVAPCTELRCGARVLVARRAGDT